MKTTKRASKKSQPDYGFECGHFGPECGLLRHIAIKFDTQRARDSFVGMFDERYGGYAIGGVDQVFYVEGNDAAETVANCCAECEYGNEISILRTDRI